jgi:hypothetical protein
MARSSFGWILWMVRCYFFDLVPYNEKFNMSSPLGGFLWDNTKRLFETSSWLTRSSLQEEDWKNE